MAFLTELLTESTSYSERECWKKENQRIEPSTSMSTKARKRHQHFVQGLDDLLFPDRFQNARSQRCFQILNFLPDVQPGKACLLLSFQAIIQASLPISERAGLCRGEVVVRVKGRICRNRPSVNVLESVCVSSHGQRVDRKGLKWWQSGMVIGYNINTRGMTQDVDERDDGPSRAKEHFVKIVRSIAKGNYLEKSKGLAARSREDETRVDLEVDEEYDSSN
ncbi:hypothetical protein H4582DRAFT_2063505 [Lactarius indigo]|nr:hypothetical protein H4582DRAFT_2063505 [Lactarius indigo]